MGMGASVASAATGSGYFSAAGSGPLAGTFVSAAEAPLPNGDVLITGGAGAVGISSGAQVFDPTSGTFSIAGLGSMSTPRYGSVAAPLPGGEVLVAGGLNSSGTLSSAELFNPTTGAFSLSAESLSVTNRGAELLSISGATVGG